jgi:GH24 family phage-related lysozyme (muramidase)
MENRFLEMDLYLKEVTGKKNGSRGSKRTSSAYGLSYSASTGWAKSLSAQTRSLVILIENEGVDLGIPELVDKILSLAPMSSLIPDSVKQSLINFIRDKLKEFTDNLLETAELTLNRYSAAAPDKFNNVTVLRNSTASYQELKNTLINLSKENKIIDLFILTHGREDFIAVTGDIDSKKIKAMKDEYGKPLSLRSVYMMNCKGSTLNEAWLYAGAKASSGSIQNNYLPEPTMYFFWNNWKEGQSFENAATSAYRKTINLMNAAVNSFLKTIPVLSSVSVNFENFDFVKDSAPVVQGPNRSVTINTDDLTFTQSLSSGLATTVLPVDVLKRLQTSRSFETARTQSWSMSQKCVDMIKGFEGFRAKKYNDPAGHCTIGYGTLLHKGNCNNDTSEQPYVNGISEEQATQLLIQEASEFQKTINDSVKVELNQNQYDSLVSFSYNIGSAAFQASTLLKLLNKGDYTSVPTEMKKWTKAKVNGKTVDLPGLVKRREDEANLFSTPMTITKSLSYYTRTFSVIDYTVPGTVPVIQQPSRKTCWAAVITMMISWKEKRSIAIRDAIATIGEEYVRMFDEGKILTKEIAEKLYKDARLEPIYSYNPSIDGWVDLLQKYGPLYVDIGFVGTMNTHAVIVTGLKGGGTADDTDITFIDPDTGTIKTTLFRNFLKNYETEGAVNWPYTIVHWPAGAFSGMQSISRYSRPFYDTGEHSILGQFINNAVSGPLASVGPLLPTTTYLLNTVPFTYGQIITLGDFYDTYYDAHGAPANELTRLKTLIQRSENHYKNTVLGIGSPAKDVGTSEWASPTVGIGQRYLDLAIENDSHFAPPPAGTKSTLLNNKQSWEEYHGRAIQAARKGTDSSALDEAYPINAFGDHFLTDAFAAGHLVNKEAVMNRFINNVMTSGKVNSAGQKMFERIADGALAVKEINKKLGSFEVISSSWYEPNWDLNDTGAFLPEVFYRILVRVMEDTKSGGTKKIANLAAKAIHDYLNRYQSGGVKGVPVRNNKGNSWNLTGDGTLNLDNIKIIQLAVKQSVENISDSVTNMSTPVSTYYQRVWDYVPNMTDPTTSRIVNDAINEYTNPSSDKLVKKAVDLIGDELDTLLNELLKAKLIQCKRKTSASSVAECQKA